MRLKKQILEDNQLPTPSPMGNSTTPTPSTSYTPSSTPSPTSDPTPCTTSHITRSNDTYVYGVHTTLSLKIKNSSMKEKINHQNDVICFRFYDFILF